MRGRSSGSWPKWPRKGYIPRTIRVATVPSLTLILTPLRNVSPMPALSPVPYWAPITGVIPIAKPSSMRMKRFIMLFTNPEAASSGTLCQPIMMLSAKAMIMMQACPSIMGIPILSILMNFSIVMDLNFRPAKLRNLSGLTKFAFPGRQRSHSPATQRSLRLQKRPRQLIKL